MNKKSNWENAAFEINMNEDVSLRWIFWNYKNT